MFDESFCSVQGMQHIRDIEVELTSISILCNVGLALVTSSFVLLTVCDDDTGTPERAPLAANG